MYFRKAYAEMLIWKNQYAADYALFLKGARGVGKTTLAEKLGKEHYRSYLTIRFDQAGDEVKNLFINVLLDLDAFFSTLELIFGVKLYKRESLIILGNIQFFPLARQALKTLLEDRRYDYVETGTLAGITKGSKSILAPSEEYEINVYPFDFEEFLLAQGSSKIVPMLRERLANRTLLGSLLTPIMKKFTQYMMIGGMPRALKAYVTTKDLEAVDIAKQTLLASYRNDIDIQNVENSSYARAFIDQTPAELSERDKRFVISHIHSNARLRNYSGAIHWLEQAMIVNLVFNLEDPEVAPDLSIGKKNFKCYFLDTGLLISLASQGQSYLKNELYKATLLNRLGVNQGMLLENVVSQCLLAGGHKSYFYLEKNKETRKTYLEIDFLIRQKEKIIPIEVKPPSSRSILSLERFKTKFGKKVGEPIVLHSGDIKRDKGILYLPYFFAAVL